MDKLEILKDKLRGYERVCIGFSGGVDSTFLLKTAKEVLGKNVLAMIAQGPMMAKRDLADAVALAESLDVFYIVAEVNPLVVEEIRFNDKKRCYYCKKNIFSSVVNKAECLGYKIVADGKNTDDAKVYRPGAQACDELNVVSPLYESGFSKADIRQYSKILGLRTWEKPSNSCLFTRFPHNEEITLHKLSMIEKAEDIIRDAGIKLVRVRCHGDIARIEVAKEDFNKILNMKEIDNQFKNLGFKFTALDISGFRSGSMD